jgi:hypothetical protein
MNKSFRKILGVALISAAVIGLIFSLVGIVGTWYFKPALTDVALRGTGLAQDSLETTAKGLIVTQQALKITVESMSSLQSTIDGAAKALESTQPLMESVAGVLDNELPGAVSGIQNSLIAAEESAKVIDGVLRLLSGLPLLGMNYDPDEPLHESLKRVSDDLGALPSSLTDMETSLTDSIENITVVQEGLSSMADSISEIGTSLESYDGVVQQYLEIIDELLSGFEYLHNNLPTIFTVLAIALSIFFLWMILAQIGLVTQGVELWRGEMYYYLAPDDTDSREETSIEETVSTGEQTGADNLDSQEG